MKRAVLAIGMAFAFLVSGATAVAAEVNVYSARKEALIKPLLDDFTDQTGIKVNLVTGNADALIKRLESEGKHTPADLLITTDAGRLHRAKAAGLFKPIQSPLLSEAIPASYRDPDNTWFGLSVRSRPIMYVKGKVDPAQLARYEQLADSAWKGRICVRSSNNIYNQSWVASMIAANGEAATEQWAKGLVANLARDPKGGDRDQIKAASAGQCDIAIANTYYLGGMLNDASDAAARTAATAMGIIWPNQEGRGAHVNVSGAGVTAHAKNEQNAIRLLEFLVSDAAQKYYADVNFEYPVKTGIELNETLKSWGSFKPDPINLSVLGESNAAAVKLMDRAGWR